MTDEDFMRVVDNSVCSFAKDGREAIEKAVHVLMEEADEANRFWYRDIVPAVQRESYPVAIEHMKMIRDLADAALERAAMRLPKVARSALNRPGGEA